jgi:hypothetical protein
VNLYELGLVNFLDMIQKVQATKERGICIKLKTIFCVWKDIIKEVANILANYICDNRNCIFDYKNNTMIRHPI